LTGFLRSFARRKDGASLAEFAMILPILLLFIFGTLEIGYLMWQFQQGEIAAKRAVRIAATRSLLAPGSIPDCGPAQPGNAVAGTECASIADYSVWATCRGDGSGGGACGADLPAVAAEIARFYPRAEPGNIVIQFSGGGMGFVGLGHPVPVVTVRFEGVKFEWVVLGTLANLAAVDMPTMSASAAAEDLRNGP
jgi:hypothetical protein